MHVVDIMLSRKAGGVEQVAVDYCRALQLRGHRVTAITHPRAWANAGLKALNVKEVHFRHLNEWDLTAPIRLRRILKQLKPDIVIAHSNRAVALSVRAVKGVYPIFGMANNYSLRRFAKVDAVFSPTHDMATVLQNIGLPQERIFHIPNMVEMPVRRANVVHGTLPVIGTLGRFVEKKGFHIYLQALKHLRDKGYGFSAVLAGAGKEEENLRQQVKDANMQSIVNFPGWIDDRASFYAGLDIFCLPSLHEPFGIVLLEAFAHGVPVVATDTEGPVDICVHDQDSLVVPKGDAIKLAEALECLLNEPMRAKELADRAFAKVLAEYSTETVSHRLDTILRNYHATA